MTEISTYIFILIINDLNYQTKRHRLVRGLTNKTQIFSKLLFIKLICVCRERYTCTGEGQRSTSEVSSVLAPCGTKGQTGPLDWPKAQLSAVCGKHSSKGTCRIKGRKWYSQQPVCRSKPQWLYLHPTKQCQTIIGETKKVTTYW